MGGGVTGEQAIGSGAGPGGEAVEERLSVVTFDEVGSRAKRRVFPERIEEEVLNFYRSEERVEALAAFPWGGGAVILMPMGEFVQSGFA